MSDNMTSKDKSTMLDMNQFIVDLKDDPWRTGLYASIEHNTHSVHKDGQLHRVPDQDDYGPDRSKMAVSLPQGFKTMTVQQVVWFLVHDAWESDVHATCDVPNCSRIEHLALADVPKDEDLLALVQSDSKVSLAQLYQRGRQKGLISARSSGY